MTQELEFLIITVKEASKLITEDFEVKVKDDKGDLVTNFDYDYYTMRYNEAKKYLAENEVSNENMEDYIYYEIDIVTYELLKEYDEDWKKEVIVGDLGLTYYHYYLSVHNNDKAGIKQYEQEIKEITDDLKNDYWQGFVNRRIKNINNEIEIEEEELKNNTSTRREVELNKQLFIANKEKELLEYRLKENLPIGGNTYLDDAINIVSGTSYEIANYKYSNGDKYDYEGSIKDYYINHCGTAGSSCFRPTQQ